MILVDSNTWLDYFNGNHNRATQALHQLLGKEPVYISDLGLTEVLLALTHKPHLSTIRYLLSAVPVVTIGGLEWALRTSDMRTRLKVNIATSVDPIIRSMLATYCIEQNICLLSADPFFNEFLPLGLTLVSPILTTP